MSNQRSEKAPLVRWRTSRETSEVSAASIRKVALEVAMYTSRVVRKTGFKASVIRLYTGMNSGERWPTTGASIAARTSSRT
jgi:hypothetical protein